MLFLLVDTAGTTGGVLLARTESADPVLDETRILGTSVLEPRQFSVQLISSIAQLLQSSRIVLSDVDAFAVASGPGSFTGLRVGLSAVKALAEASGKPVVALSRLAVLASTVPDAELVHAVLDAGRGEFYYGAYRNAGQTRVSESFETLATLSAKLRNDAGTVVTPEPSVLATLAEFAPRRILKMSVEDALPLALSAWRVGLFSDVASLDANYLRRHDVEMPPKGSRGENIPDGAGKP